MILRKGFLKDVARRLKDDGTCRHQTLAYLHRLSFIKEQIRRATHNTTLEGTEVPIPDQMWWDHFLRIPVSLKNRIRRDRASAVSVRGLSR